MLLIVITTTETLLKIPPRTKVAAVRPKVGIDSSLRDKGSKALRRANALHQASLLHHVKPLHGFNPLPGVEPHPSHRTPSLGQSPSPGQSLSSGQTPPPTQASSPSHGHEATCQDSEAEDSKNDHHVGFVFKIPHQGHLPQSPTDPMPLRALLRYLDHPY